MNFFEEFSKLSDKDKKEVLDLMKLKANLENEELRERIKKYEEPEDLTLMFMYCDEKAKNTIKELQEEIEKLENVIVGLECDVEILSEQIEDDCIAHEEALKWYKEAQELAFEEAGQRKKINEAIEYVSHNPHPEWEQVVEDVLVSGKTILNILRSED